ncbi:hypothetical protein ACJQWK_08345 [Exserohilum turcicum]
MAEAIFAALPFSTQSNPLHLVQPDIDSNMKSLVLTAALTTLTTLVLGAPKDPYPAPCGRSDPSGICTTKSTCYDKGGFWVQRDCTFYNVLDIGCCYSIPDDKK